MTSPIFALGDAYVQERAKNNPVAATYLGITEDFDGTGDFGPDGVAAEADRDRAALAALDALEPADQADQVAAIHMRERLEASLAAHDAGEWKRSLRAPYGMVQSLRNYVDMGTNTTEEQWETVAMRLDGMPDLLNGWVDCLRVGLADGTTAARRQVLAAADQAQNYVDLNSFDSIVTEYGDGPLQSRLAAGAAAAHTAYGRLIEFLRNEYAPKATEVDGVGAERYAIAARLSLGSDIDLVDAYQWGWDELHRLEAEMAAEADKIVPGGDVAAAIAHLDATEYVDGAEAYLDWLKELHQSAFERLDGTHFDIDDRLKTLDVVLVHAQGAGSAYYTGPSEDLTRAGRTWWPVAGRTRFSTWSEATTVFHEGIPGHHLQIGQMKLRSDRISRFNRSQGVSGHSEGWALYAEKLADELGWHTQPGWRLGMLKGSALRAARVVIDIGVHLDLPLPEAEARRHGPRWNFEVATEVLRDRGRIAQHRLHPEIVRYFGWPGQAITYKLGERAWLAARDEARARPGFDLKDWHTKALNLGPMGLGTFAATLRSL
ncbi:uncharacterized protein (DUF885 family) [Stackebrandtia endophytica]|uniref:Uncharacterized protein (DUF885 family) n=1 Tax=Stackebrandtia endophytica TaxID=1496996 RepID=A0A543AVG4_9ACTN|nr:DUF885 domain-containing protein [Stackebrandtia endophytica]TQL76554.1 uncharacterized protein (DUF885 family) [Stackebrandtia endophytica]